MNDEIRKSLADDGFEHHTSLKFLHQKRTVYAAGFAFLVALLATGPLGNWVVWLMLAFWAFQIYNLTVEIRDRRNKLGHILIDLNVGDDGRENRERLRKFFQKRRWEARSRFFGFLRKRPGLE